MPLRQDVQDAFATLGLTPDVDLSEATKAYKRLALLHHPDRNHNDPSATQRFQQIGHAWDVCQKFYDNPAWANRPEGAYYPDEDDIELDGEDLFDFYMFMFSETLFDRYNRARGQRYRHERSGRRAGPLIFTFSPSFSDDSQERQDKNSARQKKEKEEYEKRKRELELEIEQEERKAKEQAKKKKADMDRVVGAHERAFQAAHSGNSEEVQRLVKEFSLDVNAPRNLKQVKNPRKQDENAQYESLLHAAACRCDEALFTFLLDMGAKPNVLNKEQLSPFHVAIKSGNSKIVRFILEKRGKLFQDYHPSKATPLRCTPLQLAIESNDKATIELLVKHATTHNVERCWKAVDLSEEVRDILRTKKAFVPPGEGFDNEQTRGISKKAQQQQEKEARIAEEVKRAEINRQKKEERAARRAVMEQEKAAKEGEDRKAEEEAQEIRRKAEEDAERQRMENLRRAEEEAARVKTEAKAKKNAERESKERAEREAEERAQREAEERAERNAKEKAEREAKEKADRVAKERAEREAKERAEQEAKEKAEREAKERAEQDAKERAEKERTERETKERGKQEVKERPGREAKKRPSDAERMAIQKQRLEGQRLQMERLEREKKEKQTALLEKEKRERKEDREKLERVEKWNAQTAREEQQQEAVAQSDQAADIPDKSTVEERKGLGRPVLTDERRRELKEKQKERRKAKAAERREKQTVAAAPSQKPEISTTKVPSSSVPQVPQSDALSRKKLKPVDLEQMDDRQRAKHEQATKRRAEQSARDKERHRRIMEERRNGQVESRTQSEQSEYVPLTPVSTDAGRHSGFGHSRPMVLEPMLVSSNTGSSFMEDIQTCVVPDDLFRPDPPYAASKSGGKSFSQPAVVPTINEREPSTGSATTVANNSLLTTATTTTRKPHREFFRRSRRGIPKTAGYPQG